MSYKLTGTSQIPEGAVVNLAATSVVDAEGKKHTRIEKGQVLEVESIEHPERLQAAVDRGHLIVEEVE